MKNPTKTEKNLSYKGREKYPYEPVIMNMEFNSNGTPDPGKGIETLQQKRTANLPLFHTSHFLRGQLLSFHVETWKKKQKFIAPLSR